MNEAKHVCKIMQKTQLYNLPLAATVKWFICVTSGWRKFIGIVIFERICWSDFVSPSISSVDHGGAQRLKPHLRKCKSVFSFINKNKAAHQQFKQFKC